MAPMDAKENCRILAFVMTSLKYIGKSDGHSNPTKLFT